MKRSGAKKRKSLQLFCPRLSDNFPFSVYLFKKCIETLKMINFQQEKGECFHKYFPAATGTAFSHKFILDAKV